MLSSVTEVLELRFLGSVDSVSSVPSVIQCFSCEQNVDPLSQFEIISILFQAPVIHCSCLRERLLF